jgi:hypothetical protein
MKADSGYLETLKRERLRSNLDVLEFGRSKNRRVHLADLTVIPLSWMIEGAKILPGVVKS